MENLFHKTWLLGLFGFTTTGGAWLLSENAQGALRDIGLIITVLIGASTLYYLVRINRNRERREAIELARAETLLCEECRKHNRVVKCNVPQEAWPPDCPLMLRLKTLEKIKKMAEDAVKEETTKK